MNIQAEKLQLMKLILETENPQIIESIKKLFAKEHQADFWGSLTAVQKLEIEQGIAEIEKGDTVDYDAVMAKHRR